MSNPQHTLRPLVLFGPTASGKSYLALALAEKLTSQNITTHIVNCDALQLYTHLPILTAQPTTQDKAQTPHHLYSIINPTQRFSAGLYAEKASNLLQSLYTQESSSSPSFAVILCGGSGLYLKVLLEGLSAGLTALPQPSRLAIEQVRQWQKEARNLYALLQQRDPATAATLAPQDKHRIIRALEFYETCGSSLLHARKGAKQPSPLSHLFANPCVMSLVPCRQTLYAAINARFERMLKQGAIEEVRALLQETSLPEDSPLRGALGFKEIEGYVDGAGDGAGEMSYQAMVERGQQRTRNYAKRQLTWMRHQLFCEAQGQITLSVAEDCLAVCAHVCQFWFASAEANGG